MKEKMIQYIEELPSGELIYPLDIFMKFNIEISAVYQCLEELREKNILTSILKIICPKCDHRDDKIYNAFWELPAIYKCPICGEIVEPLVESYLVYVKI